MTFIANPTYNFFLVASSICLIVLYDQTLSHLVSHTFYIKYPLPPASCLLPPALHLLQVHHIVHKKRRRVRPRVVHTTVVEQHHPPPPPQPVYVVEDRPRVQVPCPASNLSSGSFPLPPSSRLWKSRTPDPRLWWWSSLQLWYLQVASSY